MTPPRGVEDAAPYILGREPSANRRGGLPPSLAPLVRHPSTPPRRGRACPARSLASAPGFVLHPFYLLHRREGLRGCEQGPRLSGAKPGCEQCLPLRGKQPHERVCEANWRRSLCAAKRPRTPAGGRGRPPCQRGLSPLGDWGIPTGLAWPPVTPADGQESLRLACARHLPLTREAFFAGRRERRLHSSLKN